MGSFFARYLWRGSKDERRYRVRLASKLFSARAKHRAAVGGLLLASIRVEPGSEDPNDIFCITGGSFDFSHLDHDRTRRISISFGEKFSR